MNGMYITRLSRWGHVPVLLFVWVIISLQTLGRMLLNMVPSIHTGSHSHNRIQWL